MTLTVIHGSFGSNMAPDIAGELRALADAIDKGEITAFCAAYATKEGYEVIKPSSTHETVFLATLLHSSAVKDMYR